MEIREKFVEQNWMHKMVFGEISEAFFALAARHDMLYIDQNFAKFSTRRIDDTYRTFSENLAARWPGYILSGQHIVNESDRVIHMDHLLALLRSKDLDRYQSQKELFFGNQARYTTGNSQEQMQVVYATYPRSGNSLMRKIFENVTGTATGSDQVLKHSSNVALQFCGFKAEGLTDERMWINKTHFPFVLPFQWDWESDIAVVCTRYQLDADPSFFYLTYTQCHSAQFKNTLLDPQILPFWRDFQRRTTHAYKAWFQHWIDIAENTNKPVFFFRFEDILSNQEEELRNLFKFILGLHSLEGTVIEKRIEEVMAMGSKRNQTYKPRQGGTNRNLKNYTPEQLEYTKAYNEELFHMFGYVKDEQRIPDNNTPFLDYQGKAKTENVAKTNYYKKLNQIAMEKRMRIAHGDLAPDK